MTDNKKFGKTVKPFFSDKGVGKTDITLIESDQIFQEDSEVAKILGGFFWNAVKSLNINIPEKYKSEGFALSDNPIENIISIYSNHPSIKLINENVVKGNFSFSTVKLADIEVVTKW